MRWRQSPDLRKTRKGKTNCCRCNILRRVAGLNSMSAAQAWGDCRRVCSIAGTIGFMENINSCAKLKLSSTNKIIKKLNSRVLHLCVCLLNSYCSILNGLILIRLLFIKIIYDVSLRHVSDVLYVRSSSVANISDLLL